MKLFSVLGCLFLAVTVIAQEPSIPDGDVYGEGVTAKEYTSYDGLMKQLMKNDTVKAALMATVSEVCQAKGCWMTLEAEGDSDTKMMVRFKDYGFFVPKDISGRTVLVEGKAYKTVVPVDELRHYAEDAGKPKDEIMKITEPEESYAFLASGVVVLPEK